MTTWDQSRFDSAKDAYLAATSLTLSQALNKKAFDLSLYAGRETKKANVSEIRAQLGPVSSRIVSQKIRITKKGIKRGKLQGQLVFPPITIALAIKKLGKPESWQQVLETAKKIFNRRIQSVAFIKQGWIPSREILRRSDRGKDGPGTFEDKDLKRFGKYGATIKQGGADVAKPGFNPIAKLWNAVESAPSAGPGITRYGQEGLIKAFEIVTKDMLEYVQRKMNPDAAKFNARQK